MKKKTNRMAIAIFLLANMLCATVTAGAQEVKKSSLQQQAEAADAKKEVAKARSLYIHAFNDYANKGQLRTAVECAAKATALYYKENFYQEAFDLLRRADQTAAASQNSPGEKAAMYYLTTKERLQMYIKMRRNVNAQEQAN